MYNGFEDTVDRIAGGMLAVFLGLLAGAFFRFALRLVLFRGLSENDYGVIILAMTVIDFIGLLAAAGLKSGSARFISFARGEKRDDKIWGTIESSARIGIVSSLAFSVLLFFLAEPLSRAFNAPELTTILRIFAFALPFFVAVEIITGIFRGFDRVGVKAIFEDLIMFGLATILVLIATLMELGLNWTAFLISLAFFITALLLFLYALRKLPSLARPVKPARLTRALLLFSIPLAFEAVLNMAILWTDTFMLGIYEGSEVVGIYNTAVPFARLQPIFLLSLIYIFLPVATKLLAEGKREDIRKLYKSSTKWAFSLTLPLFLTFFLFSKQVILFFAGQRYYDAWIALTILSLGLFTHVFMGPNGMTLVVLGKSRLILLDTAVGAVVNIILNALLIPVWGIKGAAIASAISLALLNVMKSSQIYWLADIHPFSRLYLKSVLLTILGAVVTYPIFSWLLQGRNWMVLFLYPLYLAMSLALILASRSLEMEDVMLVSVLLNRMRIDPTRLRRFLLRFVAGASRGDVDAV